MVRQLYEMMRAAASMTIQLGLMVLSSAPRELVTAPPRPRQRLSWGMVVLLRRWVMVPPTLVKMMVNRLVAVAHTASKAKPKRRTGTITVPPPTPSRPLSIPITKPASASSTASSTRSHSLQRDDSTQHDTAQATRGSPAWRAVPAPTQLR